MRTRIGTTSSLALLALASTAFAGGDLFVVDDDGGADFTDLPAAVAAVADGATLLVRDGAYSGFELDGKGLAIVADTSARPIVDGGIAVRQLAADQRVVLRGLETGVPEGHGLELVDNAGPVRVEDCALRGADGVGWAGVPDPHPTGYRGVHAEASVSVALARSTVQAGDGADISDWLDWQGVGGEGLYVAGSTVAVLDTTVRGGEGGSDVGGLAASGTWGGNGVYQASGSVLLAGATIEGGSGGHGGSDWTWGGCGNGGSGAVGYLLAGGELRRVDTTFVGGPGGFGVEYYGCSNGFPGVPWHVADGEWIELAGAYKPFAASSPIRAQVVGQLVFEGDPGELALGLFSPTPVHLLVPELAGALLVGSPSFLLVAGAIPAGGSLTVPVGFGDLASAESLVLHGQSALVDPGGAGTLGGTSTTVLLALGL